MIETEKAAFLKLEIDMSAYLSDANVKKRIQQQQKKIELQKLKELEKHLETQLQMQQKLEEEIQQPEYKTRISFLEQQKTNFEYINRKPFFKPYHNPYNQGNPKRMKPRPPREEVERATELSVYQLRYNEGKSLLGFLLAGASEAILQEERENNSDDEKDVTESKDSDSARFSSPISEGSNSGVSSDKPNLEEEMRERLKTKMNPEQQDVS